MVHLEEKPTGGESAACVYFKQFNLFLPVGRFMHAKIISDNVLLKSSADMKYDFLSSITNFYQ